ncbi:MAG: FHA domain-containing protein [Bacteroidaceae bacterium]|nr:FHA domain-containing protein [Bacteroidaceae bacterium]
MKRVRCPKCDHYNTFDETLYAEGQSLVFECEHCRKQFKIRIGTSSLQATQKDANRNHQTNDNGFGSIQVVENVFGFRQSFALKEGDNVIGRYNPGDKIDIPIDTTDRSMDRRHCVITVKKDSNGKLSYSLRDWPSLTGTFLFNRILADREKATIEDGDIITLGATTIILQVPEVQK